MKPTNEDSDEDSERQPSSGKPAQTPRVGILDFSGEQLEEEQSAAYPAAEQPPPVATPPPSIAASPPPAEPSPVCIVCMDAAITHIMVPCGHLCLCEACSGRVMASRGACPKCNQPSSMAMRVYGE